MIPRIIHQVWLGGKNIPDNFLILQEKLLELHTNWEYKLWTEESIEQDSLCSKKQYDHAAFAGQSNLVRLYALKKYGGIYLDFDFDVLKSFDSLLDCSAFVAKQPDGVYCNAFIGSIKEHRWINDMLANYGNPKHNDPAWGCHIIKKYISNDVTEYPTFVLLTE